MSTGQLKDILVPDIGDFDAVEIIDIAVGSGDSVAVEDTLITLESDKATMDIPAPAAGVIKEIKVKIGDQISQGGLILTLEVAEQTPQGEHEQAAGASSAQAAEQSQTKSPEKSTQAAPAENTASEPRPRPAPAPSPTGAATIDAEPYPPAHASPAVRKFARELGVNLKLVRGSGNKGRILREDVMAFTKAAMGDNRLPGKGQIRKDWGGLALPEAPPVDFAKFGPVKHQKLSRLQKLAGQNLHRSWVSVPQVTQFDEADITELEAFRLANKTAAVQAGGKLTLLSFLVKAVVAALQKYPEFNASLSPDGEQLILKNYYHIGFAVNTADGLMVPVVKDAEHKGLLELAAALAVLAQKARDKKLTPAEMQGGCFTISSLGHIGGTGFTPIVNAPEVAIMGVCRSAMRPVHIAGKFEPRLILPYSISYDHRVIDGVAAAAFARYLGEALTDIRQLLL